MGEGLRGQRGKLPLPCVSAGTKQCLPQARTWAAWARDRVLHLGWSLEGQQKDQHLTQLGKLGTHTHPPVPVPAGKEPSMSS